MGCGSSVNSQRASQVSFPMAATEASLEHVRANAEQGLPTLIAALHYVPPEAHKQLAKLKYDQGLVNRMFEAVPGAMGALTGDNSQTKAKVAACAVIERCVHLSDQTGGVVVGDYPEQCQQYLAAWLVNAVRKARATYIQDMLVDERFSKESKSIALAAIALCRITDHGAACKKVMMDSGGIKAALSALKLGSGINIEAQGRLASMLSCLVAENPAHAKSLKIRGAVPILLPYLEQNEKYPELQEPCFKVIEACLEVSPEHPNKDGLQMSLEKFRTIVQLKHVKDKRIKRLISLYETP